MPHTISFFLLHRTTLIQYSLFMNLSFFSVVLLLGAVGRALLLCFMYMLVRIAFAFFCRCLYVSLYVLLLLCLVCMLVCMLLLCFM